MLPTRPRIGITSGTDMRAWGPLGKQWTPYADAVAGGGGEPVHLGPHTGITTTMIRDLGLRAVLFTGGKDIDLASYPNPPDGDGAPQAEIMMRHRMQPEPDRDAFELPLLQEALERDLPVLGICRGCQLLHVGLGGRLILDIPLEVPGARTHTAALPPDGSSALHPLCITPGGLLARILDPHRVTECNSRHHQAVICDGQASTRPCAVSPDDGIIEAIEVQGRSWALGVQWHPEHFRDDAVRAASAPLFAAFVAAAG